MSDGVTVREIVQQPLKYQDRFWCDDEILNLFPDGDGSLVNPLLRRAQAAEARVKELEANR